MDDLTYRSLFLVDVFEKYIPKDWSVLEVGCGDNRNIKHLKQAAWKHVTGIDKIYGSSIETVPEKHYDVIYTMSCLFLIPKENEWVFEKIARMADKYIITIEGETTTPPTLIGRDYTEIFKKFGFEEVEKQINVFNSTGVLRVLKRI
jgi:hypothetical protein